MKKRICSIFLLLTLLLALLPLQANAVTAGMAALDMQEISRTEYQISKDVKEYEWLLNNGSLTKQMVGHVMEVKVGKDSTATLAAGYSDYNIGDIKNNQWAMVKTTEQAQAMETRRKVNVVGAINGGGFDMSNGRPSGALVLDGTVIQSANSTTFWVDKENVAHITDGTEYTQAVADGRVSEAISSFGDILSDGKAYTGLDNSTRASRTAVGIKPDGSVVLFMVDGRQSPYSAGMTMAELAAAMEELGCERAINLDGGGSSTFATQREGDVVSEVDPNGKSAGLTLRCRPSDGYERRVSNTLMVLSSAKATGEFDHAVLMPNNEIYTPGSTVAFKASGVDGGGFPMDIPAGASWSLTEGAALGSINAQTGVFTANEGAEGTVTAALTVNGEVAGTTQIELHWPDTLGFTNNSVSLDFGKTSDMTFKPTWNGREVRYKDGDFVWSLDESEEISYKYTALVEEKGYGFSKKWSGGKPFKWTGPNLDQEKTPWGVAPKIFMSLTGNIGETQMIEWGAGDGSTYQTYFTEKSASYQVGADGTITVQELLTHDKAEKLTDDGWKECTEDENIKLVHLEHTFTIGQFENNQFVADKKNSLRAMAQVVLKANPSVSGSIELVVGLEPLVLFDFEAPDASTSIESYWNTYVEPGSDNHEANNGHGGQLSADEIQKYRLWVRSGAGRVGANYAGSGVVTGKENGVRFGEGAYKLAYDFNQVSATAPIAADFGYSCDLLVNMQQPTKIGMWVNVPAARKNDDSILKVISAGGANSTVDGNGYNKLNANGTFTFVEGKIPSCVTMYSQYYGSAVDEKGNTVILSTLSDMAGRGWIWVEADISSMQMPIDLYRGYAVHLVSPQNAGKLTEGSTTKDACKDAYILIDNIQFIYGTNTNDINNPTIESVTETTTNTVLYDGQEPEVTGSSLNFTVNYSDSEATDKYASGIDTASTRVYIDGVNQTANAEINTGSLYLRNLNLRNGEHSLTVYLKDLYGNETNTTYYFRVADPEGTEAGIAVVPQQAAPEIGKEFALYVVNVTNERVSSADLEIEFPASYLAAGVTVEAASGYTASLGTVSGNRVPVHIEASPIATQMARTVQEYNHEMACLVLTIPESAASDKYFEYSIAQATYQTPSGRNTFVGSAQRVMLETACELHVDRTLLVGTKTTLRVTDRSGEPQARASIYAGETLLGKTGPDGTLKYTFTTTGLQTLHAVSSAGRSQNASAVVCDKPYVNEGLPFGVQNNAVAGASTAQSITWLSSIDSSAEKALVRYAEKADMTGAMEFTGTSKIQFFVESTSGNALRCNIARLSGLSSGTTYYYQVGDGTTWSEVFHFTTADPTEQTTNFFILGDIQTSSTANLERALQELRAGSYDFGIQTGDAIDDVTKFENWQSFFTVVNQEKLNGTALVHALGNHEYMGDSDGEVSGNIFDLPQSEPNLWYAVEYGDVCVVVVNHQSEGAPNGSLVDATAEIAEKLKTDCSWKVLVTHMPVYGTEGVLPEASIKAIAANLEKAGIDFVFSGDDNSYTRTYPMIGNVKQPENSSKGIVYYICGDLSGKTATCTRLDCHAKVIERTEYQGLYMTAEATRESMTIRAYKYDGTLLDTYTKKRTDCELGKHTFNSTSLYDMLNGTITCARCAAPVDAAITDYNGVLATTDGKHTILADGKLKKDEFSSFGEENYHSCADGYAYVTVRTDERTCIKGGRTTDTCPACDAKNVSQFLYPLGHEWDNNHVCSKCGYVGVNIASDAVVFKFRTPENPRDLDPIPKYAYLPGGVRPSSFGKHGNYVLTSSNDAGVGSDGIMKDLYVQWPNNKDIGTAKIVYEGKGNYYGTVELTYVIIPARVEKLNVTESAETTAKLTWSAAPGATYYKVYSCNKSGGDSKMLDTTDRCEFALTGLVPDETTYYFVESCAKASAENNKEYSSGKSPVCTVSALPLSADVTAMTATVDDVQIPAVQVDGTNYLFLPASANLASLNAVFTRSAEPGDLVVTGDLSSQNVSSTDPLDVSALASETNGYRTITAKVGNGTAFTVRVMQATSLPTVYLTSTDANAQGRAYVDGNKQNTTTAALRMIDANGGEIAATNITELKARGNSTFTYAEKKSYQIKLETASNLLQTGENVKTWVLLANYFDATLMHDKLFKDMAASLQMPYTASCNWVNLYYDGEYRGVYLLSEKNTIKSTGVDITDMEDAYKEQNPNYGMDMQTSSGENAYGMTYFFTKDLNEPANITGGYLLELNHDKPDEVSGFITRKGKGMNVKSPEWCGKEAMRYISEYYQAFEDAVYATDETGAYTGYNESTDKHYYDYVDRDSLVKIFLMQELALNPDGFVSSLYFYKDAGEKMYAGPIWDQDMTLGTGWTKEISPDITDYHYLAQALIKIPDFRAAVVRCYNESFAPLAKKLIAENGTVSGYATRLTGSAEMNFVLWPYIRIGDHTKGGHIWQNATYVGVVADMQSWLTARTAYLDSAFAGKIFEIGDVNMDGVVNTYTASTDEFPVTALKGGANMPAATVNPVTKMLSWNSNDGNVVKMQEFGIVDVKIPANTPAGTYELGFSKLKLSENYGADIWESTATAYATLTIAPAPVAVSNITLNKNTLALTVGGSETLTATVYPENATNKDVTWSSDNENAATVDANGTVTAVGEGEAIITATTEDGKYTATCTVKVSPAPVAANGVTLTPDKTTLNVGEKQTLTATVLPAYATNKNVTWVSSDTSVATVENGVVTAVGKGTATITVTTEDGGYTATCEVTVKLPVSAVTLNETSTALVVGNTKQLTATVVPANADDSTVTWKSGNTNVATVDQTGKVTAVGVGTTTITATAGGKSATCTVTVTAKPVPIEAIALRDAAVSVGGTIQLEPVFTPADTTQRDVVWTSSDRTIATVDANGRVRGVAEGKVTITVTSTADRSITASCTVTVTKNLSDDLVSIIGALGNSSLPFNDVTVRDYFYDAVKWAVDRGITSGTSRYTFSPDAPCTRAQVVTFLWRAAGCPQPTSKSNPFTDVRADDYFYTAVLWAVENGITNGTSAKTFSPDATVTRAQVVTFLWRANGQPAAGNSGFADVSADKYYATAVAWAVSQRITTGTGFGVFSPDAACTRAQIVTFLYRAN